MSSPNVRRYRIADLFENHFLKFTAEAVLLAIVYFIAAKLGLALAFVHPSATAVWPPTGIALAALVVFGYRLWPGVFLGAFIANVTTAGSVWSCLGIATGNSLEAVIGAWLMSRFAGGPRAFERPQNVLKFAVLEGAVSTPVSATVGVTSIYLDGFARASEYGRIWFTWWLGDLAGALIVAPLLILSLAPHSRRRTGPRTWESSAVFALLAGVGYLGFAGLAAQDFQAISLAFVCVPILLWTAVRLGRRAASIQLFLICAIAIWGTVQGRGPFVRADGNESLLLLQQFGGTLAVMILMIGAAIFSRNRTEQALRQSEQSAQRHFAELDTIYRTAPVGLGLTDRNLRFLSVNDTLAEIDGISAADHAGRTLEEILPKPLAAKLEPLYRRVLETGEPVLGLEVQGETRANPGVNRVWNVNYHPVRDARSEIIGVSIMVQEITERRRAEEEIRYHTQLLKTLIDNAQSMLYMIDTEGRALFLNRAAETLTGYRADELIGQIMHNRVHYRRPDGAPYPIEECDLRRATARGEFVQNREEVFTRKDGTLFPVQYSASPVQREGIHVGTVIEIQDITERKRSDNELRDSRRRLSAIIAAADVGTWDWNLQSNHVDVNDRFCTMLGYEPGGFGHDAGRFFGSIHPDDLAAVNRSVASHLAGESDLYQCEFRLRKADGTYLWIQDAGRLIERDAEGNPLRMVGIHIDITEHKRAEAQLKRFNEELEKRVAEGTAELRAMNNALLHSLTERNQLEEQLRQAQKMESLGTLAGGIAHDFNNILNIIQGYNFILREQGENDSVTRESVTAIDETVRRGSALVRQLLTLARRDSVQFGSVDANALVKNLLALVQQTFPKTIQLITSLEADLPPILADPNHIHQALLNIVVNARDAMSNIGRLTVKTFSADGASLGHLGDTHGRYVCMEISDTGTGMDDRIRARIFEPFFTTKDKSERTGLGLSVVYGIVKNHNGFIEVESEVLSGTCFRLYFPVAAASAGSEVSQASPSGQNSALPDRATTVLVVDDEASMVHALEKILSARGITVLTAADGESALDVYRRHKATIDVVLLDMGLPKIAGREVLLKMRAENPGVKVIVASGYVDPEVKSEIDRDSVHCFLHKPYMPEEVVAAIQRLIASGQGSTDSPPREAAGT